MSDKRIEDIHGRSKNSIPNGDSPVQGIAGGIGESASEAIGKAVRRVNETASKVKEQVGKTASDSMLQLQTSIYRPVYYVDDEIPKMVAIEDDSQRKKVKVYEDAIGWSSIAAGLDVLHLYEGFASKSGIVFFPQLQLNSIYYQDNLDKSRYISLDCYFDTIQKDKFTELKRIAYDLGAKKCRLESYEQSKVVRIVKPGVGVKKKDGASRTGVAVTAKAQATSEDEKRIVFEQVFENNEEPRRPELKWFAHDKEIEFLIDTRCNGGQRGITKQYSMQLDSMAMRTMNVDTAVKIDKALAKLGTSCNFSLEGEALTEERTKLVFEIDF